MLQSALFTKTLKNSPAGEEAINAQLLIRGGFARKISAGVFAYLPMGLRVLQKIAAIVREEMNAIGSEEVLFPALIAKEYWEKSARWGLKVGYEFKTPTGEEVALGWTHEEIATAIATHFISSYKDLPRGVYQIQTKFRAEARAKSGLLRGREFLMKDLYSFHASKEDLDRYYEVVSGAYSAIMKRLSLPFKIVEAAGGAFTKEYTHEFQVLSPVGEDTVYFCAKCFWAQNKEVAKVKEGGACPLCGGVVEVSPGIEVANIFKLGTRYSEAFNLNFTDADGGRKPVVMGSYGIGISRLLATLTEVYHDDRGIIWPVTVAPFRVHLLTIAGDDDRVVARAKKLYTALLSAGVEVLFDDRGVSAGEQFGDADLIGIPYRVLLSEKTGSSVEVKLRHEREGKLMSPASLIKLVS